jgi:hypothetical protein
VPSRIVVQLDRLRTGLIGVGMTPEQVVPTVRKVALDSIPALKRDVLGTLRVEPEEWRPISDFVAATGYAEQTLRRALHELRAHGVVENRRNGSKDEWRPSTWTHQRLAELGAWLPEMSEAPPRVPEASEHLPTVPEKSSLQELEGRQIGKASPGSAVGPSDISGNGHAPPDISGRGCGNGRADASGTAPDPTDGSGTQVESDVSGTMSSLQPTIEDGLGTESPSATAPRPITTETLE